MSSSRLSRRDVLRGSLAAAALGVVSSCARGSSTTPAGDPKQPDAKAPSKKRILILGGTGFLGPKTVQSAIARGHEVTIFNRGKREKVLPLEAKVEHLYGNRDPDLPAEDDKGPGGKLLHPDASPKGLEQLAGKSWDVVIDNSGFYPRHVSASAKLLAASCKQYIYISSVSAYDESTYSVAGGDETTKLATLADPKVEDMGKEFENYGGLKVLCERAAQEAFPNGCAIVRPGYIVGPGDPTDRFTYWPVRISQGGDVLAPGSADDPLQWIDVRDLADWLVTLAEHSTTGVFNALGPNPPGRWGDVLQACVDLSKSSAKLDWVPSAWLEQNGMGGEDSFPIWAPPTGKFGGFHRWKNARAVAAGLTFRSAPDTVKAILDWYPGEIERRVRVTKELADKAKAAGKEPPKGDPSALRAGPTRDQEQQLLAKYRGH